jgi:carboxymethylenebutenolidase
MSAETIILATADGPMPTYVAEPEGTALGGVVVVQEAYGITDHIEQVARRFAHAGWRAVAPALFHRSGSPVFAYDGGFDAIRPAMGRLSAEGVMVDLDAALAFLAGGGAPLARTGVVGFCMGGSVTTYAAATRPLGAAVSFYGGGLSKGRFGMEPLVELAPRLQTPWLGIFGDLDQGIPVDEVEAMRSAAKGAPAPTEIIRYPDAQHGFHCDDRPAVYDADAARDAWARTLIWLEAHIPAP